MVKRVTPAREHHQREVSQDENDDDDDDNCDGSGNENDCEMEWWR